MKSGKTTNTALLQSLVRALLALLLLAGLLAGLGYSRASQPPQLHGPALLDALRQGGYNIYFRHAATDWSLSDRRTATGERVSCDAALMRQLSTAGRDDSRRIGAAMRAARIPVSEVLASPYCRTVETARLMQLGDVRATDEVMNLRAAQYFGGRPAIVNRARLLLASLPPPGGNRVIVAHGNVAREATPVYPGEGEAVVFRPRGEDGFELVGRIRPDDWARLAAAADD